MKMKAFKIGIFVFAMMFILTTSVNAQSYYGEVKAASGGNSTITGDRSANVTVLYEEAELQWYEKDLSVGRTSNGWWIGINIYAPTGIDETTLKKATYSRGGEKKSFWTHKDSTVSPYYMGAWTGVDKALLKGQSDTYTLNTYELDWNGDGTTDQTITLKVKPTKIEFKDPEPADGKEIISVTIGSREFTVDVDTINKFSDGEKELLEKIITPKEGYKFVGLFDEDGKQVNFDDKLTDGMVLTVKFEKIEVEETTTTPVTTTQALVETPAKDNSPKTGTSDLVELSIISIVVSGFAIMFLKRRYN